MPRCWVCQEIHVQRRTEAAVHPIRCAEAECTQATCGQAHTVKSVGFYFGVDGPAFQKQRTGNSTTRMADQDTLQTNASVRQLLCAAQDEVHDVPDGVVSICEIVPGINRSLDRPDPSTTLSSLLSR